MNLIFTGVGEIQHKSLTTQCYHNWQIQSFRTVNYIDACPVKSVYNAEETDLTKIDKSKLVYLTADSENNITELDPSDVYIIGGIVDRNRYKNLSLDRANEQGIRHGRLPIVDYVKLQTSCVLTVNQIFEMMAVQLNTADWKTTFDKVIPQRKIKEEKGPNHVVLGEAEQVTEENPETLNVVEQEEEKKEE